MTQPLAPPPRLELAGEAASIRPFEETDARDLLELRHRNLEYFRPYEPSTVVIPATLEEQSARLTTERLDWDEGRQYVFGIFRRSDGKLVGRIALSHVSRAAWQNAVLGYFIDEDQAGNGFASEAARLVLGFAFDHAGLHRVQAGIMPRNTRSIRVAQNAGMRDEGTALRYLEINGTWEDHTMFAITREEWK
jgi:[ribosomal protein S5]-alanine N-acetyltransferase